jgi:hypothetical protein
LKPDASGVAEAKVNLQDSNSLTKDEAEQRAAALSNVEYEVSVALPKGDSYYGHLTVKFDSKVE